MRMRARARPADAGRDSMSSRFVVTQASPHTFLNAFAGCFCRSRSVCRDVLGQVFWGMAFRLGRDVIPRGVGEAIVPGTPLDRCMKNHLEPPLIEKLLRILHNESSNGWGGHEHRTFKEMLAFVTARQAGPNCPRPTSC